MAVVNKLYKNYDCYVSFENLHAMAKRATPEKLMLYKLSLQLFRIFYYSILETEWDLLNQTALVTQQPRSLLWHKKISLVNDNATIGVAIQYIVPLLSYRLN